jgi:hypothetical protein
MREAPACWSWPIPPTPSIPFTRPDDIALFVFDCLEEWQGERCAICGRDRGEPVTDHCHRTGIVRGFLCRSCNLMEGHAEGAAPWAAKYRRLPPTVILKLATKYGGWGESYCEPWIEVALGRHRPGNEYPGRLATFLADAANLPHETQWFADADAAGFDYRRYGLRSRNEINLELMQSLIPESFRRSP